ncbi:hypothetical protein DFQ27_009911 [Actinomortierella ambigua]|uniref:Uncharacterized protein n=1 Tax=Actinomortierella ambigua TaxID=1343610 RepID=A0A9P6TWZ5_9FUNG|nr:hypothetical protein DFQ27_009911 [Actinomortierella ambigua]
MAFSRFILRAASTAGRIQIARTHLPCNSAAATASGIHHLLRPQQKQPNRTFVTATRPAWAADVQKGVETITDLFMIARDELEYAEEAKGTVYYNEDKETARAAVQDCLDQYGVLMSECTDEQKTDVQRKIGLKIQELKAQLDALNAEELED